MSSKRTLPIIVAGAGIGGLAAALALARKGRQVLVLERAPEIGEIGYGIQMGPNGYAMLEQLGVEEPIQKHSFYPDALILGDAISGDELTRISLGDAFRSRYGRPYFVIHRRDLHGTLANACREYDQIVFEPGVKEVSGYEHLNGGVRVPCTDGTAYEGIALIGAEGLRSPTRDQLVNDGTPRVSGHVVYRGLVPTEEVIDRTHVNSMIIYGGHDMHLVQYRLRGGTVMNNVATFVSPRFKKGEKEFGQPDELFAAFEQCAPKVRDMLRYVSTEKKWILHDRDPVTKWTDRNVTLLGDSAHPTLQYLAQGAVMAMEDAVILAREVNRHGEDYHAAFLAYEALRMNRSARVVLSSRFFGEVIHAGGGARLLRNELLSRRSPDDPWEIDWLYHGFDL